MKHNAYIGLGSNQGDRAVSLAAAFAALGGIERTTLVATSPVYETEPIDAPGPDFLNAVACVETELEPYALLLHLQDIEMMLGRKRRGLMRGNEPRKVDLDLLLMGALVLHSVPLWMPHPRMHQRAFVLRPLLDLAPAAEIPGMGPARAYLPLVRSQRVWRSVDRPVLP